MLNVSGPDAGLPGIQGNLRPGAVGQGKAIYNKASVTTKGRQAARGRGLRHPALRPQDPARRGRGLHLQHGERSPAPP